MTEQVKDNPISNIQETQDHQVEQSDKGSVQASSADTSDQFLADISVILSNNQTASANESRSQTKTLNATCDEKHKDQSDENQSSSNSVRPLDGNVIRETMKNLNARGYRDDLNSSANSDDNSDSSDSDSSSTVSEDNDDSDNPSLSELNDKKNFKYPRTKGELTLADLPPIEDLKITIDESKCKPVGSVFNMVDTMVIVQSFPNTPPLDIDTVLFLDRGQRPLGKIFDVFGPVQEPLYCVRFNSQEHIKEKNITKEQVVYCAPQTKYTSYIHTAELMKTKGSDASWTDNNEPPISCLDFSDDEEEGRTKKTKAVLGSKREIPVDGDPFVKKMNQKNLELTAKRKKEDEAKQKRSPLIRRVMSNANSAVEMVNMNSQSCFSPFTDNYKLKSRTFTNESSRLANFHHNANNTHTNKFDAPSQSVNYMVGGYTTPSNFTFPPQHFLCTSPRQLPNVTPTAQNYLTMYSRPPMHSMPPFSSFNSPSIPPLPSFPPQPTSIRSMPQAMHPSMSQFSNFNPMPTLPLPTSLPQNYYQCTDAPPVPQQAFMPINVRPTLSASFHPQFVLPPPPPPPPPTTQHHSQPAPRSDRRAQSSHQTSSFYPNSPYNS